MHLAHPTHADDSDAYRLFHVCSPAKRNGSERDCDGAIHAPCILAHLSGIVNCPPNGVAEVQCIHDYPRSSSYDAFRLTLDRQGALEKDPGFHAFQGKAGLASRKYGMRVADSLAH